MKKSVRLTESDLTRIIQRIINEEMDSSSGVETISQLLNELKTSYASFIAACDRGLQDLKENPKIDGSYARKFYFNDKLKPKFDDLRNKIASLETTINS